MDENSQTITTTECRQLMANEFKMDPMHYNAINLVVYTKDIYNCYYVPSINALRIVMRSIDNDSITNIIANRDVKLMMRGIIKNHQSIQENL